jgi:hypothetical protein
MFTSHTSTGVNSMAQVEIAWNPCLPLDRGNTTYPKLSNAFIPRAMRIT